MKINTLNRIIIIGIFLISMFYHKNLNGQVNPNTNMKLKHCLICITGFPVNIHLRAAQLSKYQRQNSRFAGKYSGQVPAIWSTDMGFAKDGDTIHIWPVRYS